MYTRLRCCTVPLTWRPLPPRTAFLSEHPGVCPAFTTARFHMSSSHPSPPPPARTPSHRTLTPSRTRTGRAGGRKVLLAQAGKDATEKFWQFHSKRVLDETAKPFLIGRIATGADLAAAADFEEAVIHRVEGEASVVNSEEKGAEAEEDQDDLEDSSYFGGMLPAPPPHKRGRLD